MSTHRPGSSVTLKEHALAATSIARELSREQRKVNVTLGASAMVGVLGSVLKEHTRLSAVPSSLHAEAQLLGDHLVIELLVAKESRKPVNLDKLKTDLTEHYRCTGDYHQENGRDAIVVRDEGAAAKLHTISLATAPRWVQRGDALDSPRIYALPPPVVLLYLLYETAEAVKSADQASTRRALTLLYVFSILVHLRKNEGGVPAITSIDWRAATWDHVIAQNALQDDAHKSRYSRVLDLLREGPTGTRAGLPHAVLHDWATRLSMQTGYRSRTSSERILVRLQTFLEKVTDMLLPNGASPAAHSLGKSLPAGMAVFHPDSARRRAFEGRF